MILKTEFLSICVTDKKDLGDIMIKYIDNYTRVSMLAALAVMTVILIDVDINTYVLISMVALSYLAISYKVIIGAVKTLIVRHRMSEEFLMTIATFGALALGDYAEALAIIVFYRVGTIFEEYAQGRSHSEITSLLALKPEFVRLVKEDGSDEKVKPRKVAAGSITRVLLGESVAIDGELLSDSASVNLSALTGESEPVVFFKGDIIPSGGINLDRVIEIKTTVLSKNSSINRLINLIEDAAANKSRPEALIYRFSTYYTPIVVAVAAALALIPFVIEGYDVHDWVTRALVFLVLSCPCALVLSVPLSFFGGIGAISKTGVMVKGSIHIENLAKIKSMAFDKTGTLTYGVFSVSQVHSKAEDTKDLLYYMYNAERMTTHPLGVAIASFCKDSGSAIASDCEFKEIAGFGLEGKVDGTEVFVGRYDFIKDKSSDRIERLDESGGSDVYCVAEGRYIGALTLKDEPKAEAASFIKALESLNIKSYMITGDKEQVASDLARTLGIDSYFAQQLPQDKLTTFKSIKREDGICAFVGDGINDAPVLAASDVGIAMGQFGSSQAVEASDVVVMNDNLNKIADAIVLSRRTVALAISNMVLVIGVKLIILILGAFGFANIWLAVLGDVGLCIVAVLNAMRALTWKGEFSKTASLQTDKMRTA